MKRIIMQSVSSLLAIWACLTVLPAHAAIVNGGFEAGFAGWTRADQIGSDGTFTLQSGVLSPVNGVTVPSPPGGSNAAMTDPQGPGSHVLYQDFMQTSAVGVAILSFDLFVNNQAGTFTLQDDLDFATPRLNQQARVDILMGGADPFSLLLGDVLFNAYQTAAGDPAVSGYFHYDIEITALLNANLNTMLRLRFAEVDNVDFFQFGVDNVNITVREVSDVPEPASWLLLAAGILVLRLSRIRRH